MADSLFRITEYFLTRNVSTGDVRLRARIAVISGFFTILALIAVMLVISSIHGSGQAFLFYNPLISLAVVVLQLLTLKFTKNHEPVCLAYFLLMAGWVTFQLAVSQSLVTHGFLVYQMQIMFGLLMISDPRRRAILVATHILGSIVVLWCLREVPIAFLFDTERPFILPYAYWMIPYSLAYVLSIAFGFVYIKNHAIGEMEREFAAQVNQEKLIEISSSLKSLVQAFYLPAVELETHLRGLEGAEAKEGADVETIEEKIKTLIRIAQSMGWIYRAYRSEPIPQSELKNVCAQLELLLRHRLRGGSPALQIRCKEQDTLVGGALPILILLLLTLAEYVQSYYDGFGTISELRCLDVEVLGEDVTFALDWERSEPPLEFSWEKSSFLPADYRLELIAELLDATKAKLEVENAAERDSIKVTGFGLLRST